ncbi:hypothetical protein EZV62_001209 [Acer yangbiense]|uniref:Uncharacterized protein n=1 Tax=Acer yangbiense TaxID=1000413 RepID=A0A5C7ITF1_9ROSI|nr:hypothetical protein EZV62_001209 [Acer yangbiense]
MADSMEIAPSSSHLDLDSLRSQVVELVEIHRNIKEDEAEMAPSDSENLLKDCALHLESKVKEIISECSDVSFLGIEDLDAYVEHLKEELKTVKAESIKISNEIENLSRTHVEVLTLGMLMHVHEFAESSRLESDLEELNHTLDLIASQGSEKAREDQNIDCSTYGEDQSDLINIHEDHKFEILELESQIEKNKIILDSLQDLDSVFKRFEAAEQIEDLLTGLKVIEVDGNCFRLSLQTYIPKLEGLLFQQRMEDVNEPSEVNHELLIEIVNGSMELKNVEIFPNDVDIGDIVDGPKSFRLSFPQLALTETRTPLQWFVRKVQERIIISTLRRFLVKAANKSRHFFEYLDRDEMVVAHLVEGIDAFIKLSQGWPLLNSPLKLISLKSSDHHSKGISLSFLCKVEEAANSLDVHMRQNLSSFVDAVEKILVEQKRLELHSDDTSQK